MVIKYSFLDNTTSEVEVDDELGKHIAEMDEADYNLNRKGGLEQEHGLPSA